MSIVTQKAGPAPRQAQEQSQRSVDTSRSYSVLSTLPHDSFENLLRVRTKSRVASASSVCFIYIYSRKKDDPAQQVGYRGPAALTLKRHVRKVIYNAVSPVKIDSSFDYISSR